ncbi:LacI family DNA-binding transcriptional regulator [Sporolituus thermophilus]|uniref:Transcriptional regulator, LacI family n=1 Tax=Sporolituus thermophilus DSM 23256 TaxID=1123285 RepID=A0A1G7LA33_9FIRM|nr:LacI family DNA-binding transcriptional regulator [Sporolituus thermophilus]SDF46387.1 transcriptional regulator, LacI family [Sporolituus thermophilus DSM 23256]
MKTSKKRSHVTLQDVAAHAGVSRATASLVLRGSPNISEATRQKVLAAMQQLGYVYDRIAANLRSNASSTVGLIIMELANPFYSELLVGIHQELDKFGYTVILGTTFDSHAIQERLLSTMLEHRVGGIILSAVPGSSSEGVNQIIKLGIPVVLVGRKIANVSCDYVGIDNVRGGQIAAEHLIRKGHRRIAFLGGFSQLSSWQERKRGYDQAHYAAGLPIDNNLVVETPATRQGGIAAIQKVLTAPEPPTAAFCYNDMIAIGAMMQMKEMGFVPGRDMAIVGFDDIPEATIFSPKLTTVSSFPRLMGIHAARLLHAQIEGAADEPQTIILQPELIVRESCSYAKNQTRA